MSFSYPSCAMILKTLERYCFMMIAVSGRREILGYLLLDSVLLCNCSTETRHLMCEKRWLLDLVFWLWILLKEKLF